MTAALTDISVTAQSRLDSTQINQCGCNTTVSEPVPVQIPRLPNEVLLQVFQHFHKIINPFRASHRSSAWRVLSKVCHQWRDVSLCIPRLWAEFRLQNEEETRTLLERARCGVPLDVNYSCADHPTLEETKSILHILDHTPRIRTLRLDCPGDVLFLWTNALDSCIAPHLHEFAMVCRKDPSPFYLRDYFLKGPFQYLRKVTLINCDPDWRSPLFAASVTQLTLHDTTHLTVTLRRAPMPLVGCFWPQPRGPCTPTGTVDEFVELPNLEYLNVDGLISHCGHFLAQIRLGAKTTVKLSLIHISAMEAWDTAWKALERGLRNLFPSSVAFQVLNIGELTERHWSLCAGYNEPEPQAATSSRSDLRSQTTDSNVPICQTPIDKTVANVHISFAIRKPPRYTLAQELILVALSCLPVRKCVESFHLSSKMWLSQNWFIHCFGRLPLTKNLSLEGFNPWSAFSGLYEQDDMGLSKYDGDINGSLFAPQLRRLEIRELDDYWRSWEWFTLGMALEDRRDEQMLMLESMKVRAPMIDDYLMDRLEEVVPNLVWESE